MSRYAVISSHRGEHLSLVVTVYDGQAVTTADITAWTVGLWVAAGWDDDPLFTAPGVADNAAKTFTFTVPRAMSDLTDHGNYVFKVERTDPGDEAYLVYGDWRVKPSLES